MISKSKTIISVNNITKRYGSKEVLKGINFDVKKGERISIIGSNGAGKSTLTEIISQIKEPTSGTIEFPLYKNKIDISSKIGIQFQESTYPMFYKVIDIINFFIDASRAKISKEFLKEMLETFHLNGIENSYAQGLSGGQKQRLNILLSIIHQPSILLLDEVSTGLDIEAREDIKQYIKKYLDDSDSTLLLVSHNPDEIKFLTNRIIVIHDGLIYEDKTMNEIIKEFKSFDKYIHDLFVHRFKKQKESKVK